MRNALPQPAALNGRLNDPVAPDLKSVHWEWQASNPASALARDGFRPGLYGRLDKDRWFHTTVTNVVPTAKQSYVIHYRVRCPPSVSSGLVELTESDAQDLRVLTVRELARSQGFPDWFVFYAEDGSLKTVCRAFLSYIPSASVLTRRRGTDASADRERGAMARGRGLGARAARGPVQEVGERPRRGNTRQRRVGVA